MKIQFDHPNVFDVQLSKLEYDSNSFTQDPNNAAILYFNPEDTSCVVALDISFRGVLFIHDTLIKVGKVI